MAGESHTTTDHDTIKQWTEKRDGVPATVQGTSDASQESGILRIMFPQEGDNDDLVRIDWQEFFDKFEQDNLAFLYQEETSDGETSRFFKFVSR